MKIIILIACILALVHADDISGNVYRKYLADCGKELLLLPGLPTEQNPLAHICAARKIGAFDDNAIDRNKLLPFCERIISNPDNQVKCRNIIDTCLAKANKPELLGSITSIAHKGIVGNIEDKEIDLAEKVKLVSCGLMRGGLALVDL